jgi:hypothetical protein
MEVAEFGHIFHIDQHALLSRAAGKIAGRGGIQTGYEEQVQPSQGGFRINQGGGNTPFNERRPAARQTVPRATKADVQSCRIKSDGQHGRLRFNSEVLTRQYKCKKLVDNYLLYTEYVF